MKKRPSNSPKNDDVPSLLVKNVSDVVSGTDGAISVENEVVLKGKPSKTNKISCLESGDNVENKTSSLSNLHEKKKDSKKNIPKSKSDENIAKAAVGKLTKNNVNEKGPVKETKSKQNESKSSRSQNKVTKPEESKGSEKTPPFSSRNKKNENNVAESPTAIDIKDVVPFEQSTAKDVVLSKVDKFSSAVTASKKSSNAVANNEIPSGKITPAIGSIGQKSSNNVKSDKNATSGDIKSLQKLSKCYSFEVSFRLQLFLQST